MVLHYAIRLPDNGNKIDIVQLQLQYRADTTCKETGGRTPLTLAARCQRLDYPRLMVPDLSTLPIIDEHRNTISCLAASKGDVDWVSEIIRLGTVVNKPQPVELNPRKGDNVLEEIIMACLLCYKATESKSVLSMCATLQELLECGGHLIFMYTGSGFLHYVATAKYLRCQEKALIAIPYWGADLDAIDEHGMTLLHYAAQCNDSRIISLLLQYETSLNVKIREEKSTVQLAEDSGPRKIVDLLMRKAAGLEIEFVPGNALLKLAPKEEVFYG